MPAGLSLLLARIKWHCTEQALFFLSCNVCFRVALVWPRDEKYVVLTTLLSSLQALPLPPVLFLFSLPHVRCRVRHLNYGQRVFSGEQFLPKH